nr:ShlB/FhaC/HecB family hemolysin secretion/activation protein [Sphingomonas yunnanensis]
MVAAHAGALTLPGGAVAQERAVSQDRDARQIIERLQQQERDRAERFERSRDRPPTGEEAEVAAPAVATGEDCAVIRQVRLVGVTRYRPAEFAAATAELKGDCVGLAAIDAALHTITARYIGDGYVTSRAFVGPQDLKGGILTITVIEGRLADIRAAPGRHYGAGEIGAAFPLHRSSIVNLRALEQGVDQLARLQKGDPGIDVEPGDLPGTSTILVERGPLSSWIRPAVDVSNDGAAATGRLLETASLDLDSPLGIADSWSLYASRGGAGDGQIGNHAYGGFASLPRGWWTLALSGGAFGYRSVLHGHGLTFATRGRSWNGTASLDRMLHRNARTKLSADVGLSIMDTANYIRGIQLRTGSYRIVAGRIGGRWQRRLGESLLVTDARYTRGLRLLGAHTVDTGPGGATGRYRMISGDVELQSGFAAGRTRFVNTAMLRWQRSPDELFPAQRFSLGGTSTVPGFREDGISGRSGALLREQLGIGLADVARDRPALATNLSAYVAYDLGIIQRQIGDPFERGTLESASVGARAQSRHGQLETALAVPLSAPSWVRHKRTEIFVKFRMLL